jgi:transposase-like protein
MARPFKQSYPFEVKLEIVELFVSGQRSVNELASDYDLSSPQLVRNWVRLYRAQGQDGLRPKRTGRPPGSAQRPETTELERLREQNLRLQAEVAYLKKLRALRNRRTS